MPSGARNGPCEPEGSNSNRANRCAIVPPAAGTFSPQRPILRLDGHSYSPSLLQAIVTAAARLHSFADAAFALGLSGLSISPRHVQQLAHEIGTELVAARDARADARRHRVLEPRVTTVPEVVVVEVDGGRLRTRATGCGPGVHQAEGKEDKIAALATLSDAAADADPCPEPPPSFVEPRRIQRLVAQMKEPAGETKPQERPGVAADASSDTPVPPATPASEPWSPKRVVRTCVASLTNSRSFGPLVAAEAQSRNFYAAKRRAFVADGAAYNWTIQRGYFPDFEPIVDLLHVVCYLFHAARAVSSDEAAGWTRYEAWLRAVWQGRVRDVIAAMTDHQDRLGRPPPEEQLSASDPRQVLAEAVTYLRNHVGRMDYPRYRREGLPTTSSLVESLVGEFNARVKGRSKFWNRPAGAEAILQVRAAVLSEDGRLEQYFAHRPGRASRRHAA